MSNNGEKKSKPTLVAWKKYLEGRMGRCSREGFYGTIQIKFIRGHVTQIEVTESIKDPEVELAPENARPVV